MQRITQKTIFVFMLFIVTAAFEARPQAKTTYEWKNAAGPGNGCFPPNCGPGKYPMGTILIVADDGKLYMVGSRSLWTSDNGINWSSQPKTDWGERHGMRFAYFAGKMWMIGGMKSWDDFRNDVWNSEDGRNWKQLVAEAAWPRRRGHSVLVFKDKLWVLGGAVSSGQGDQTPTDFLNDVWSSGDGVKWEQVVTHAPWSARDSHITLVFNDKIWVIGGGENNRDVWSSSNGKNWVQVTDKAQWGMRRGNGGVVFDGKMWIFGGIEKNDVWSSSDGKNWSLVFRNAPWSTRSALHSAVFGDKILLFSGKTGRADSWAGDIWAMIKKTE